MPGHLDRRQRRRPRTGYPLGARSYVATSIEALQPRVVVIENVRGLLSATATRPATKGQRHDDRNPDDATSDPASAARGCLSL